MSRLEGFLRRLEAQRVCLTVASQRIANTGGDVLELGLGHGRTFDHLRHLLPDRRVIVVDNDLASLARIPEVAPQNIFFGDVIAILPRLARSQPSTLALIHSDLGDSDEGANRSLLAKLAPFIVRLLVPRGVVVSSVEVEHRALLRQPPLGKIRRNKYYFYAYESLWPRQ